MDTEQRNNNMRSVTMHSEAKLSVNNAGAPNGYDCDNNIVSSVGISTNSTVKSTEALKISNNDKDRKVYGAATSTPSTIINVSSLRHISDQNHKSIPTVRKDSMYSLVFSTIAPKQTKDQEKSTEVAPITASSQVKCPEVSPKVYKRRIWMLALYVILAVLVGIMYPEYSSMSGLTSCYYGVSQTAVAWTNSMPNLLYVILVFPATSIMEKIGLRWTFILGALLNTAASALQFATLSGDSFWLVMVSVLFSSVSAVTVLGTPPVLASRWFPNHELSRACAVGVAGYQLGMSAGSLFPLAITSDCSQTELIKEGKMNVAIFLTAVNSFILILIIFTFQKQPLTPPSLQEMTTKNRRYSAKDILKLTKNKDFMLLLLLSGFFVGVYCAVLTTLNNLILRFFPDSEVDVGWMGCLYTMTGIAGGFVVGYILDRTHKYKQVCMGLCLLSIVSYGMFSGFLYTDAIWIQYITLGVFGIFVGSFVPLGYEYAIEVTYPISETLCSNTITASGLLFAVILTQAITAVLDNYGEVFYNIGLCIPFVLACIITGFTSTNYKRHSNDSGDVAKNVE